MHANSQPVNSTQNTIHKDLARIVAKHAATAFRKPVMPYNQAAFDDGMSAWRSSGAAPLILDSGCGVGLSTRHLAARFPDHFVMGIDQSADRITRHTLWPDALPRNFILLRADLADFWRLLQASGARPARHYLLYPNPWPKVGQLARRWHGHAVFPTIVALGGQLECRSNWKLYIDEFAAALTQLCQQPVQSESYVSATPITPFEQKYIASGHALWRCQVDLAVKNRS